VAGRANNTGSDHEFPLFFVTAHPRLKTGFLPRITRISTDPSPVKIRVIREIRGKKNASVYEMVGEMANRSRLMGG